MQNPTTHDARTEQETIDATRTVYTVEIEAPWFPFRCESADLAERLSRDGHRVTAETVRGMKGNHSERAGI